MPKKVCLFLLILTSFTLSCTADEFDDAPQAITPTFNQDVTERGEYHVLVIGNSHSRDAFSYAPPIMTDLCPNINLDLNIYYKGGVGMSDHWNSISQGLADHYLDSYILSEGKWMSKGGAVGGELISSRPWDLIVLQVGNVICREYEDTRQNILPIVSYIHRVQPDTEIAYMMIPAQPEGSSVLGGLTSDEVWQMFANTARSLAEHRDVDHVIPCGTAIQNARHTYLDRLGDYGHLSYDGTHLQEGLPCFIDAYTVTQSLFNILGIDNTIEKSGLRITERWVYGRNIPGRHGDPILGDEGDYVLCQMCALDAVRHPYSITEIE